MTEQFEEFFVGVHPADAEQVQISYSKGNLYLAYIDWRGTLCQVEFVDTFAFRWQEYDDATTPRDDTSYQVLNSKWLASQLREEQHPEAYAHYKICFNACGVLDLLCRALNPGQSPHA